GTELDLVLRLYGIENLVVVGVCTDVCVSSTVQHARNLDYRCLVLRDATAGTSRERHEAALRCLEVAFARIETVHSACKLVGWAEAEAPGRTGPAAPGHARSTSRASSSPSIRSGVIGSWAGRTPIASWMALAMVAATFPIGGSPIPRAPNGPLPSPLSTMP